MVLCFVTRSSATERDEWLEAIAKAIDDYTKKKTTFISSRSQEEVKLKISVIDALRMHPCLLSSVNTDGNRCRWQRTFRFKGSYLDPRPEGHHVHDLYLWVHHHLEEASLPCLWQGLGLSHNISSDIPSCIYGFFSWQHCVVNRWCVRLALPISTTWSTWRTSQHVCVITALPSCRRTVNKHYYKCFQDEFWLIWLAIFN